MRNGGFTLPSFAKVNWFLKVWGRRADGFHEICTAFQTISLHDTISFEPADSLILESSDPRLPTDGSNLVHRAADALRKQAGADLGAKIRIEKHIPFPGGLGGGSSNAAVAMLGLAKLWEVNPSFEDLFELALEIGSDVPFFLVGGTVLGTGRGTDLEPLPDTGRKLLLIDTPMAEYSTAEAYRSLGRHRLTSEGPETKLMVCRELAKGLISGSMEAVNDFEKAVAGFASEIESAKEGLLTEGATSAGLSGSGPSVFGVFENETLRQQAYRALSRGSRIVAAESTSRTEYRKALGSCAELLPRHT
ncbi:MAG: 4-(cytidine 5'-diphospho)-2-C-methyl-D-erythritol kinase [Acidobacteriota bacterium]|nr:MAG: 4-(cytidine 5'-diphospho)-2-C-methyl-D-erythritol kinase [Acidobacteriota bacterium]